MQTDNQLLNAARQPNRPKGRWMLLLLFIFFAAPLAIVVVMHKLDWHPSGASRGHMVMPAKPVVMPEGVRDSETNPVAPEFWKEKWSMVYVAGECDAVCADRLHEMRQIHMSLAKHIPRVQRVLITGSADVSELKQKYPDLIVLNQPSAQHTALMRQFDLPQAAAGSAQRVYFVDPLSFLMMSYPINIAATDIRKDLGRLLAYAWAG